MFQLRSLYLLVLLTIVPCHLAAQDARLLPGDLIRIAIWREEDLSGDFLIHEDGAVTLPMLGSVAVAGLPMSQVRTELRARYLAEIRNPSIEITPIRRIIVLGSVSQPGLFEVDPTVSLAALVAMAGGPRAVGDEVKVRIVRDGQVISESVSATASLSSADVRSGDQVFVLGPSRLSRGVALLVPILTSVATTLVYLIVF